MGAPYLSDDKQHFFAQGTPITIDADKSGDLLITWAYGNMVVPKDIEIWGGSETQATGSKIIDYNSTFINVNGGRIKSVWGGNRGPGHIKKVTINVNGGITANLSAGIGYGAKDAPNWKNADLGATVIDEAVVTVRRGTVNLLYGGTGSGIATVKKSTLNFSGRATYATAGNSNGHVGEANLNITGGTVLISAQCMNRGTANTLNAKITGGNIKELFIIGDATAKFEGKVNMGIYGGTIKKFTVKEKSINQEAVTENMSIKYSSNAKIPASQLSGTGAVEDNSNGVSEAKLVRLYPFPNKCKSIYGILVDGKPINMPAELPMKEQEIRFALGMAHVYEVVGDGLVVLDHHNYNADNTKALKYTGKLPCDDEVSYPRGKNPNTTTDKKDDVTSPTQPSDPSAPTTDQDNKENKA